MFQRIDEKIEVLGIYSKAKFIPKKIKWKEKVFLVEEITLISELRDGLVKKRLYSIVSGGNLYRLMFNRETEIWVLEEVWME